MAALDRTDGPTLIALTRQAVPLLSEIPVDVRREGALKGGYIAKKETAPLEAHPALRRKRAPARAQGQREARTRDARGQLAELRALRAPARVLP